MIRPGAFLANQMRVFSSLEAADLATVRSFTLHPHIGG